MWQYGCMYFTTLSELMTRFGIQMGAMTMLLVLATSKAHEALAKDIVDVLRMHMQSKAEPQITGQSHVYDSGVPNVSEVEKIVLFH